MNQSLLCRCVVHFHVVNLQWVISFMLSFPFPGFITLQCCYSVLSLLLRQHLPLSFYFFHPSMHSLFLWFLFVPFECSCPGLSCVMFSAGHVVLGYDVAYMMSCSGGPVSLHWWWALKVNSLQRGDHQPICHNDCGHANVTSAHCHFPNALCFNVFPLLCQVTFLFPEVMCCSVHHVHQLNQFSIESAAFAYGIF